MLSNTLNTNEIKNASGTEVEFSHLKSNDRSREFAQIGENPSQPHRLMVSHQESGAGMKKRRRSVIRFDLTSISDVDSVTPIVTSGYTVLDFPIGASATATKAQQVLAELMSFLASDGTNTTIKFDCTGNGAACLLNGSL